MRFLLQRLKKSNQRQLLLLTQPSGLFEQGALYRGQGKGSLVGGEELGEGDSECLTDFFQRWDGWNEIFAIP